MVFVDAEGQKTVCKTKVGETILEAAHANDIELEGACGASLCCSTCHVILPAPVFEKLPPVSLDERDMLDLAACLTDTSRLGCQVTLKKEHDGLEITLPANSNNMQNP